jgi:hypothetical protein
MAYTTHVGNLRTSQSIFDNQACTASFVALPSHACNAVTFTVTPDASVVGSAQVRRGGAGGYVSVSQGVAYEIAVLANSNELQIKTNTGTTPVVCIECKQFRSGFVGQ